MPTNFPTSVDVLVNPTPTDSLNAPAHSTQHANANDAIEAVENYLLNGGQGLTLVKKQVIGTAVSSVTVTDAFSATYENYRIMISGGVGSGTNYLGLQLGATSTGYNSALNSVIYATNSSLLASTSNGAIFGQAGWLTADFLSLNVDLRNPFLAKQTLINGGFAGSSVAGSMAGVQVSTTSFTAFTLTPLAGTLTGGTIYVYGYGIGQ